MLAFAFQVMSAAQANFVKEMVSGSGKTKRFVVQENRFHNSECTQSNKNKDRKRKLCGQFR